MIQTERSIALDVMAAPLYMANAAMAVADAAIELPLAVSGERRSISGLAGELSYYTSGPETEELQPPLLLLHSINAAGSAYEVKPLYERYKASRQVYALEFPGFGFSERRKREYSIRLMTDAVLEMIEEIRRIHGDSPIDALALSLACEFLARAASEKSSLFRSLGFVSPTGFDRGAAERAHSAGHRGNWMLYSMLDFPLWNQSFFDLLTTRRGIRFFLNKTWGSKDIDEGMLEYDWKTTRQPGARYAPFCFVSGFLFSREIATIYDSLQLPVWMAHGVRGDFQDYGHAQAFETKSNWQIHRFETGALPHFEVLEALTGSYDAFLASV